MNAWTLLLTLMLPIELPPAANPCGNGSFETLGKDGFPIGCLRVPFVR